MKYNTAVRVLFPVSPEVVYQKLINLQEYPVWNAGLIEVSHQGAMYEGLEYDTKSIVVGRENKAHISIVTLRENRIIEMTSDTGDITFSARYDIIPQNSDGSEVVCTLEFELVGIALNLAHSVIESMARARIKGDLETLRGLITPTT